jgi:hypothetical protein
MIGNDPALSYLIGRFAAQSGYAFTLLAVLSHPDEIGAIKPDAILFSSVHNLEDSQSRLTGLANSDIPILVCASLGEEARVRELGGDYCLIHPVTYDNFQSALTIRNHQK